MFLKKKKNSKIAPVYLTYYILLRIFFFRFEDVGWDSIRVNIICFLLKVYFLDFVLKVEAIVFRFH